MYFQYEGGFFWIVRLKKKNIMSVFSHQPGVKHHCYARVTYAFVEANANFDLFLSVVVLNHIERLGLHLHI